MMPSEPQSRSSGGRRAAEVVDKTRAPGSPCDEILHPVGEGGGGVVDRQRLAGDGELEHPLGVDALALEPVEVLRQLTGLLVAMPDVCDDPLLPDVEGLAVPGVDPVGEVAVVRRLAVVVRWRSDE